MFQYIKNNRKSIFTILLVIICLGTFFYLAYTYYPDYNDWSKFYSPLPSHIQKPQEVSGYINPPWTALLVLYGLFPLKISNAINLLMNAVVLLLLVKKVKGGWLGILLTFTSPFFWDMARVNPIDWIPVLGFILPTAWGLPLMAIKPQTLGAAAIIKWKNAKFSIKPLIPRIIIVAASFIL